MRKDRKGKAWLNEIHNRYFIRVNSKVMPRAHVVWNKYYPDDLVKKGEMIHHINENPRDDRICNLKKMTKTEHMKIHGPKNGFKTIVKLKKWREDNKIEFSKEQSKRSIEFWSDPKNHEKAKQRKHTEEELRKISESRKACWKTTEYRQKMTASLKAAWQRRKEREARVGGAI
jgi:hypothetical protein